MSTPARKRTESVTRREMLQMTAMAGLASMTGKAATAQQPPPKRPRLACLVSFWGAPNSHADWIIAKLMDATGGMGTHTPPGRGRLRLPQPVRHQHPRPKGLQSQKHSHLQNRRRSRHPRRQRPRRRRRRHHRRARQLPHHPQGPMAPPRWWMYQQVIRVFEQSKRSVPVWNDKHFSWSWDEAKWMFDKSRELDFPLSGGSSIPFYFRTPEIELAPETPIRNSILVGGTADEGALFHCVDTLQSFVDRRKGGETGVRAVQCIRGPETWKWLDRTPWAAILLESVRTNFNLPAGHFQQARNPNVCIVEYNDGTNAAILSGEGVGWTFAADIAAHQAPTLVSKLGWPGPFSQYHASNAHSHWLIQMMLTNKEPFNAERLLLSTGILAYTMDSCWQNGLYSPIGRRIETPFLDMTYRSTHSPMFETGPRPPNTPYLRGFES